MGSHAKLYAVVGAGSVTGMFTVRELLQRGGNVRACMRDPDKSKGDIDELIAYFPRGKRGVLEYCACDVTKPETLADGAPRTAVQRALTRLPRALNRRCAAALRGVEAVVFTASGSAWAGEGGGYDVDFKARSRPGTWQRLLPLLPDRYTAQCQPRIGARAERSRVRAAPTARSPPLTLPVPLPSARGAGRGERGRCCQSCGLQEGGARVLLYGV